MDIKKYIQDSIDTKQKILESNDILLNIDRIASVIVNAYRNGKKVLTAGNGGSASDAQHIASELVSKFLMNRKGLCAFALTTNSSVITSISNDYGYEQCFARQIEANANKGDVFIAISTSGNSKNIITALEEARNKGVITVGFAGMNKSGMDKFCDYLINVPSNSTPIIQESHIMIAHLVCAIVESALYC